jgi:hypothetical protein
MGEESGSGLVFSWLVLEESTDESRGEEGGVDEPLVCCESLGIKLAIYQQSGPDK